MDANGLTHWLLADAHHWRIDGDPPSLNYDMERRRLRLVGRRVIPALSDANVAVVEAQALSRLELVPDTLDRFGMRASWDSAAQSIVATGARAEPFPIAPIPFGHTPSDVTMGYDDVLYVALGNRILLHDTRERWSPISLESAEGTAWRLTADPAGGVWVLDRVRRKVGRVAGVPFPNRPSSPYGPDTARPCDENPNPPRLIEAGAIPFSPIEQPVALACRADGVVAVLLWTSEEYAAVRLFDASGWRGPAIALQGAGRPYSVAWIGLDRLAVLVVGLPGEALVYSMPTETSHDSRGSIVAPVEDLYPMTDYTGGPFLHTLSDPPCYPTVDGWAGLHPISLPSFTTQGQAENAVLIDSGSSQTVWHRLYMEAEIPQDCSVVIALAAGDDAHPPDSKDAWHPHCFGTVERQGRIPKGVWVPGASEIPFYPGLLGCPPVKDQSGLFTALIQRANRAVTHLKGRYLWGRVILNGNGRATPEVAAVRAYASRFSYRDKYLPELYRESTFGDAAEAVLAPGTAATAADFLERFLDNMEGVLTPLEDRISAAYLLTDPRTTPEEALEWLGSWIGVAFDPVFPKERRRRLIASSPELYRKRGTPEGLMLALDIATGGAVTSGEIVVLEDFRLRRTMGTILGGDFQDEEDPLLAGLVVSGNSLVGDSLFLGQEERREFLALFAADLEQTAAEEQAGEAFLDRLAFRVTVLVHQEVEPQDLGLIRRVVSLESPAHVVVRVATASEPFLVGAASLVGVDTYLGPAQPVRSVRVGRSRLGRRDVLVHSPSLDPRLDSLASAEPSSVTPPPVAEAGTDRTVEFGRSFELDAGGSHAAEGRRLVRYIWEWFG
ncbi:MAG: phage tail protein [Nitrospira sp.]|nr:phage tail protein [Nitrospira sp.]